MEKQRDYMINHYIIVLDSPRTHWVIPTTIQRGQMNFTTYAKVRNVTIHAKRSRVSST